MDAIKIIMTFVVLGVMIYAMTKKMNSPMVMMSLGLIILGVMTVVTGTSVIPDKTTGSKVVDIFQVFYQNMITNLNATLPQVMCVMGYVAFMKGIKATEMMTSVAVKPLKRIKNKYMVIVGVMLLGLILKVFIPSQVSLSVMFFAMVYPILVGLGFSRATAISTIVICSMYDGGPACPNTGWVFNQDYITALGDMDIASFFVKYQIPIWLAGFVVSTIVFLLVIKFTEDKVLAREAAVFGESTASTDSIKPPEGVPGYYAILPLLPVVLVVIFSKLLISWITMSVATAHIICFVFVHFLILLTSKEPFVERFNHAKDMWVGMGNYITTTGMLVIASTTFTSGLNAIGGTTIMLNSLSGMSSGGAVTVIAITALTLLIGFATGSGGPALFATVPLLPAVAEGTGCNIYPMLLAVITAGGFARTISLVAPAVLIGSSHAGISNIDIVKRNALPVIAASITLVVGCIILL